MLQQYLPLAVLKLHIVTLLHYARCIVATVLTACGIETLSATRINLNNRMLQQYLPLAVLKLAKRLNIFLFDLWLQQYLPLAVLKPNKC